MKFFIILLILLPLQGYAKLKSKAQIYREETSKVKGFYNQLKYLDKQFIQISLRRMNSLYHNKDLYYTSLFQNYYPKETDPVIIFIQGIPAKEGKEDFYEWYRPLVQIKKKKLSTYFHQLSLDHSFEENSSLIEKTIQKVHHLFPQQRIVILGYSAGGSVGLYAYENIKERLPSLRINMITAASPIYGYGAPEFLDLFTSSLKIDIGNGLRDRYKSDLTGCMHFTTTNPNLDIHARARKFIFPQIGRNDINLENPTLLESKINFSNNDISYYELPCGNENVINSNQDSHISILGTALDHWYALPFNETQR